MKMHHRQYSRRAVLTGAGTMLALPWLESVDRRPAHAQAARPLRLVWIYWGTGVAKRFWPATGTGADWQPSKIQRPLAEVMLKDGTGRSVKDVTTVMTNLECYSPHQNNPGVEPSHDLLVGSWATGTKPKSQTQLAISLDQVIAQRLKGQTPFDSLQVGLPTTRSAVGRWQPMSHSISWSNDDTPLYKEIDPNLIFDRMMGGLGGQGGKMAAPNTSMRKARRVSVLDYLMEDTAKLGTKLCVADRARLDQYLTSVRSLEKRLSAAPTASGNACAPAGAPPAIAGFPGGYSRELHAELVNDLIVMALQCDQTRIVSHMLDNEMSNFNYNFLAVRDFNSEALTETAQRCSALHENHQHGPGGDANMGYATVSHWYMQKIASLAAKLSAVQDAGGGSLLDSTLILAGTCMQGSNHDGDQLPMLYVGGAQNRLRTNQHIVLPGPTRISNLYLTVIQRVFGLTDVPAFGNSQGIVEQILA